MTFPHFSKALWSSMNVVLYTSDTAGTSPAIPDSVRLMHKQDGMYRCYAVTSPAVLWETQHQTLVIHTCYTDIIMMLRSHYFTLMTNKESYVRVHPLRKYLVKHRRYEWGSVLRSIIPEHSHHYTPATLLPNTQYFSHIRVLLLARAKQHTVTYKQPL